jgi:ABC-type glutathione transport system ATPase component
MTPQASSSPATAEIKGAVRRTLRLAVIALDAGPGLTP